MIRPAGVAVAGGKDQRAVPAFSSEPLPEIES
jgi:hypothetical protein